MRLRAARGVALAGLLLFIGLATTASAAPASVNIQGFAFVPPTVTINVGEAVTWTNKDAAAHSAVVAGVGQTPVLTQNQSGGLAFNAAGTFPYMCGIHGESMKGTVIVRAAATPAPTQPPTLAPTPVPTATASPLPTTATPTTTPTPTVAVAAPSQQAPATAANDTGGPSPLVIAGAALVAIALVAFAFARIKR